MLSRYNGIGSLKMSIGGNAHNQRTSNPYISDVARIDLASHRNDTADSTYGELPIDCSSSPPPPPTTATSTSKTTNLLRKKFGKHNPNNNTEFNDLKATTKFNLSRKPPKKNQIKKHEPIHTIEQNSTMHGRKMKTIPKITSTNSIYSTSTISNSSLQEYDDNELDTTELAKYMRQINNEIHHDAK